MPYEITLRPDPERCHRCAKPLQYVWDEGDWQLDCWGTSPFFCGLHCYRKSWNEALNLVDLDGVPKPTRLKDLIEMTSALAEGGEPVDTDSLDP